MLTFKTQFPLCAERDVSELLNIGRIWLEGSPHSRLKNEFPDNPKIVDGSCFKKDEEQIEFGVIESPSVAGFRYRNVDTTGNRWLIEVAGHKTSEGCTCVVQLHSESNEALESPNVGKKPHVIRSILENFGGGVDGEFSVTDKPHRLKIDEKEGIVVVINGNSSNRMPVVYLSVDSKGKAATSPEILARTLSGMAHVVIEPNRAFSFLVRNDVDDNNAYGGAAAIYWPKSSERTLFLPQFTLKRKDFADHIVTRIRLSLLSQLTPEHCTWNDICNIRNQRRIEELKSIGSIEVEEYVKTFDSQIATKDEEIKRLKQQLHSTNIRGDGRRDADRCRFNITLESQEAEFYQDEKLGIIFDALASYRTSLEPNSRRSIIVNDLSLNNKNDQVDERDQILSELKRILKGASSIDAKTRSALKNMGFEIISESGHLKTIFRGDERCSVTLPKTSSDHRWGKNAIRDLKKQFF